MRAYHLFAQWMQECEPDKTLELFDIYIPIRPMGKERPRNGSTPVRTRKWEDYVGNVTAYDLMEGRPPITFPVAAEVLFGLHKNRCDNDNMEKILWDALQRGNKSGLGRAIHDDSLVRGYIKKGEREMPAGEEFIWVRFYARNRADYERYTREVENATRNSFGY